MTNSAPAPLAPSDRLLCGPGPTNVDPVALAAMGKPMLGHLDPDIQPILLEVVRMLRLVYRNAEGLVLPLQATGTSGMEAGLLNLTEPGDTVIVGASAYFGRRIVELARRAGCEVVEVMEDWGVHVPNGRLLEALDENPAATLLAVVHGETSTGSLHPLAELGEALKDRPDTLLMADCVTTLGGTEIDIAGWGVDYAYSCTQKCIGAPPGMSPISVSEAGMERFAARSTPVPFSLTSSCCANTGSTDRRSITTRRRSCTSTPSTRSCGRRSRRASTRAARDTSPPARTCRSACSPRGSA